MSSERNNHTRATGYGNIVSGIFVALVLVAGGMTMVASTAFVQQSFAQTTDGNMTTTALAGQISSVQMAGGNETEGWEQSGFWVLRTQFQNNTTPESADDIEWSQFIARFDMFRPDGSELHSHDIYDFELESYQVEEVDEDTTLSFTGIATVTMPAEVIEQVPVVIQILNGTDMQIAISPEAVDGHFGEEPVNGMLSDVSRDRIGQLTGEPVDDGNGIPPNGNATDTTLRLTTDMQEYQIDETVTFTAENLSTDTLTFPDAALGIQITNNDTGDTHSIVAAQVLTTIVGGESAQVEWQPEEEGAQPGNYTAAIATVAGTPPSASAQTEFTITNGNGNGNATDATLQLTTEMQEYEVGETVVFTAENLSTDTLTFSNAALGMEITNTDTNQTYTVIAPQVLTTIIEGESAQVEWDQEGGEAEPGNYTAAVATVEGTPPSASAETSFTIVENGQGQEPEQEEGEEEQQQ